VIYRVFLNDEDFVVIDADSPEEAMLKLRDAGLEPVKAEPFVDPRSPVEGICPGEVALSGANEQFFGVIEQTPRTGSERKTFTFSLILSLSGCGTVQERPTPKIITAEEALAVASRVVDCVGRPLINMTMASQRSPTLPNASWVYVPLNS
jgi:hypothetical protein